MITPPAAVCPECRRETILIQSTALFMADRPWRPTVQHGLLFGAHHILTPDSPAFCNSNFCDWEGALQEAVTAAKGVVQSSRDSFRIWIKERPDNHMITIKFSDILQEDVDAIVNPANKRMLHGGGLAAYIAAAGGPDLVQESHERAPIKTGEAIITTAGNLPFKAVIHTVGPDTRGIWNEAISDGGANQAESDELLAQAHKSAIALAQEREYASVAFPAVSCGVFCFPVERAAPIAIRSVLEAQKEGPIEVIFCLLDEDHYVAFQQALAALEPEWVKEHLDG